MKVWSAVFLCIMAINPGSPVELNLDGQTLRDQCRTVDLDPALMTGMEALKLMSCLGFVHGVVDGWVLAG
jgi:hypothetical protein